MGHPSAVSLLIFDRETPFSAFFAFSLLVICRENAPKRIGAERERPSGRRAAAPDD